MKKLRTIVATALMVTAPALGVQAATATPAVADDAPTMVCHDPLEPYLVPDPICPLVYAVLGVVCRAHPCLEEAVAVGGRELA